MGCLTWMQLKGYVNVGGSAVIDDWYTSLLPVPIEFVGTITVDAELTDLRSRIANLDNQIYTVMNARGLQALCWKDHEGFKEIICEESDFRLARGKKYE